MATIHRCDVCGDEMTATTGPAATLIVHPPTPVASGDPLEAFGFLAERLRNPGPRYEICQPCLDHLMPIWARLREHDKTRTPHGACISVAELRHVATLPHPEGPR